MKIKAILFDLDCTLVDTLEEYKLKVVTKTLEYFGKNISINQARDFWNKGDRKKYIENNNIDVNNFWQYFRKMDSIDERIKNTYVFDDAIKLLENLNKKYLTAIISNAPQYVMEKEAELIPHKFDEIITAHDYQLKPHPSALNAALIKLNINSSQAIYIGDNLEDMQAAKNANMKGILIDRDNIYPEFNPQVNNLCEIIKLLD